MTGVEEVEDMTGVENMTGVEDMKNDVRKKMKDEEQEEVYDQA